MKLKFEELVSLAMEKVNPRQLSGSTEAGAVAAAIETASGNVYLGVNIDAPCSVGFCAEHAARGAMVTAGENRIVKMAAVKKGGIIIPPCGRCREFICQVHPDNGDCEVLLSGGRVVRIDDLLPSRWDRPAEN